MLITHAWAWGEMAQRCRMYNGRKGRSAVKDLFARHPPVHAGPHEIDSPAGGREGGAPAPHRDSGNGAVPARADRGLCLRDALHVRGRSLPGRGAAAGSEGRGPHRGVLGSRSPAGASPMSATSEVFNPVPEGVAPRLLDVRKLTVHYPVRKGIFERVSGQVHAADEVSFHRRASTGSGGGERLGKSRREGDPEVVDPTSGEIACEGSARSLSPARMLPSGRAAGVFPIRFFPIRAARGDSVSEAIATSSRIGSETGARRAALRKGGLRAEQCAYQTSYPGARQRWDARAMARSRLIVATCRTVWTLVQAQVINLR